MVLDHSWQWVFDHPSGILGRSSTPSQPGTTRSDVLALINGARHGIINPPTWGKRCYGQSPPSPSILGFGQVRYVPSRGAPEESIQCSATSGLCVWCAQWLVKQCLYQIIRRFISTVMLGTNSLRSWRICMSIFFASSGSPTGCDRLVESQQTQGVPMTIHYGVCNIP